MKNHKVGCLCCICKQKRGEFITEEIKNKMSISQRKRNEMIWNDNEKKCPKCGIFKPLSEYYKANYKSNSKGVYTYCIDCTKEKNYKRKRTRSHSILEAYGDYRRNAKARNLKFELTINDLGTLIHADCYYCGKFPREIGGIDRINSSEGYTFDNSVPCCWRCNFLKNKCSQNEFASWVLDVYPWAKKFMEDK